MRRMAQGLQSLTKQEKFRNTVATILARLLTSLVLPHENDDSSSLSVTSLALAVSGFLGPKPCALRRGSQRQDRVQSASASEIPKTLVCFLLCLGRAHPHSFWTNLEHELPVFPY